MGIAHSLVEARDLVGVMQPDLMLLDVQYPGSTGLELLCQPHHRPSLPGIPDQHRHPENRYSLWRSGAAGKAVWGGGVIWLEG